MGSLGDRSLSDLPSIPKFYKGKSIFITGGSGFMGQVLIEKLLYSCSDLDRIYLLLRAKKGVESMKRLTDLFKSSCFDRLRQERPGMFESKVTVVAGDVLELGLGLSDEDRELLVKNVHIIFNVAASVKFDDSLQYAVKLNLRGTREMVTLAKDMKKLLAFVHISTCYANCNRDYVEEVIYPAHTDWRDTIEICEKINEQDVKILTQKILGTMPNTYVFTKQLAEHVINEQKGILPVVIVRPSVVISAEKEPLPGWNCNLNGPGGIVVAGGKGILRTLLTAPDIASDYIPVDASIKSFIAAGWIRGTKKLQPTDDLPIYNSCGNGQFSFTMREFSSIAKKIGHTYPLVNPMWYPHITLTRSKLLFSIRVLFLHLIPAMLVDSIFWLTGKKTFLIKVQRRIYVANLAINYFLQKEWVFDSKNFLSLCSQIKEEDKEQFYYKLDHLDLNKEAYLTTAILGGKKFLLKEKEEDLEKALKQHMMLKYIDLLIRYSLYAYLVYKIVTSVYFQNILGVA